MLANMWHLLFKKIFPDRPDEVLAVSDILPMKSLSASGNETDHHSLETGMNGDSDPASRAGRNAHPSRGGKG